MFEGLLDKVTTTKNYCKSKNEPLSMCLYYDEKDREVDCEYFEYNPKRKKCSFYYNGAVCKCQEAQDDGRK